jgi:hypothetical protein
VSIARSSGIAWLVVWVWLALAGAPGPAYGQEQEQAEQGFDREPSERATDLQNRAFAAIQRRDYETAERLLRQQIEIDGGNFVPHYNLACVLSLQGDAAGAGEQLLRAVEQGFTDIRMMRSDPDLTNARGDENYQKIVNNWSFVLEKHRDANLARAKQFFKDGSYLTAFDEDLRLAYLSATDPESFEQARADIARLAGWGLEQVFLDLAAGAGAPGANAGGGNGAPEGLAQQNMNDAWVVVVLPSPDDFQRWSRVAFGPAAGFSAIGGIYSHDAKRLVAMDLGATLRHEFFHVLHWRSNMRQGQVHPPWIQEGLCSLVEDYVVKGSGESATIEPVPSWRTNIAKRLARGGRTTPIKVLASMTREKFIGTRPLATYGQARAVFLFLWQQGKLKDWYAAYCRGFAEDQTGVKAMEEVLGAPIDQIEKLYIQWLRDLPEVAEQIRPGAAGLGLEVEQGSGDGPVVVSIDRRGPARAAGLRLRDVITAINGQPTRDLNELVRVLGEQEIGEEVEVSYRRGRTHGTARVVLTRR